MQIVGVDFGTTNVRIATWDTDQSDRLPQPLRIGQGESEEERASTMPAVIAFQRQPNGDVLTFLGEDADVQPEASDVVVVRNIKRWALAGDPYVKWHLESSETPTESWWNPETRSVVVWDREIPVKEVIRQILAEAFRRANLSGEFEWRAGCPVHSGLEYRAELAEVLSGLAGGNRVASVVEEPVLFLELARRLDRLMAGSYLVYDIGGGSFDCALAEVEADGQMSVYAAHGNPSLGGVFIDGLLKKWTGYQGSERDLRIAKEQLTPSGEAQDLGGGVHLAWSDLEDELNKSLFLAKTLAAMREAYISAKVIWKRQEGASPIGDIPSCRLEAIPAAFARDLDGIILTGGPTKSPYFRERLREMFGVDLVVSAEELVPQEVIDPELTALSMGACYMASGQYNPLYVNRLPARVTLQDSGTGKTVEYEPYRHFAPNFHPARPFVSDWLPFRHGVGAKFVLTVADSDGNDVEPKPVDVNPARAWDDSIGSLRFVIDVLGRIWIDNGTTRWREVEDTPWQTERQREILREILEKQETFQRSENDRVHTMVTYNPYGWGR